MADKRMFSRFVVSNDRFKTLPLSSQALYFHFGMNADDDGFVDSPKTIQLSVGASDDDFRLLILNQFVIPFESGIIVITHWNLNNNLRKDTYHKTIYQEEFKLLEQKYLNLYVFSNLNKPLQVRNETVTQCSEVKNSEVKNSKAKDSEDEDESSLLFNKTGIKEKINGFGVTFSAGQIVNICKRLNSLQLPLQYIDYCYNRIKKQYSENGNNDIEKLLYKAVMEFHDWIQDFQKNGLSENENNFSKSNETTFDTHSDKPICKQCNTELVFNGEDNYQCPNCKNWYIKNDIGQIVLCK